MMSPALLVALLSLHASLAASQTVLHEHIWGTVIYSLYGDRTPFVLPETNVLTPLGAQQLYSAGSLFRNRYVIPPSNPYQYNTVIQGISKYQLDVDQVTIESTADQVTVGSAQAFMQGLYPALQDTGNYTFIKGASELANGSNILAPLDGYQYPLIYTASQLDFRSLWIAGSVSCPMWTSSRSEYFASPEYYALEEENADFYANLHSKVLNGIFSNSSVGYFDAYFIWDYIKYGATHNTTISQHISLEDLTRARALANDLIFATNGNLTAFGSTPGDNIRAIAGRTLANRVVQALYMNINNSGEMNKMTLLFGSFEPMVAFAALTQLASPQNSQFYGIPEYGSSMVFELYSLSPNSTSTFPDTSDLNVRFLFQNGTLDDAQLISFPLFGRGPSQISMTLQEFVAGLDDVMTLSVEDWCETCSSFSVFCPAFVDESNTTPSTSTPASNKSSSPHLQPAIAGVIGAVVTLVVLGIALAVAMLLGGVRFQRLKTKRRSELGGFKGGEKLASDPDLSMVKEVAGATVTPKATHERVGSWELGDRVKAEEAQMPNLKTHGTPFRRPSFEEDEIHVSPYATPVTPHDRI